MKFHSVLTIWLEFSLYRLPNASISVCVHFPASYCTTPIKHDGRVNYYYGFGYAMFDDVAKLEFNPEAHIDKVKQIVI